MTVGQVSFLSTVYLVDHGNWPKQCLLNLPKWDKWSTNQRASILRVRSIAHEYSMLKQKGPMLPEDQDWVSQQGGSQPVLAIQLWNKAGIWCKFRTNNLSSPWSKFIWSQGPAADESTCAHQKCCATGAQVSSESSGWVVVWVAFGRKIQDDPGKFRDQASSVSGFASHTMCTTDSHRSGSCTETKELIAYYQSIYTIIPDHWAYTARPLVYWRWCFCLFGLRVTSIFKSWTLSVLASWSSAIMRIDLQLLVHIYIYFLYKPYPFGQSWVCTKKYITNYI